MQRETALMLLGIGLVLILLLVGVALYSFTPPSPRPVSEERGSTLMPPTPSAPPPIQTASPISPPAMVTPSLPLSPPQTAAAPTVVAVPEKIAVPSIAAPLPPTPLPQIPSSSYFPQAKPSAAAISETEAIKWARALVSTYRPKWQVNLTRSVSTRLKGESYAVTVEPSDQVTIEAKTDVGWLYGLLDLAERLQWREPIPAHWIWTPSVAERGLVVESPDWLLKPPRSKRELKSLLQKQLRELSWWRFNNLVVKCNGNEPKLGEVLDQLKQVSRSYGVKVIVWAKSLTPSVLAWMRSGGQIATDTPSVQGDATITVATEPELIAHQIDQGKVAGLKIQLIAPYLPTTVFGFGRNRNKLLVVVGLDEGYRDVFWFDPVWAHRLVNSIKEANLLGFWLSVSSVPSSWAIAAFSQAAKNPDADGETLWLRRWAKQGYHADKWLALFKEASQIIPEILWLGVSTQPQYGAYLESFLVARPIDETWGFTVLNVTETLKLSRQLDKQNVLTTDEVARRLEGKANFVWTLAAQLPEPAGSDWKVAKRLALLNSWVGQFYAIKIDAAIAWGRFEGGDRMAGQECLSHLVKSIKAWEQVVSVANSVYPPNNPWVLRLSEWRREFEGYRNRIAGAMP
ncbi:MAG: hypothetical protein ACUVTP_05735 [Candidatus Fervidibacter sp.]|uniref:hypothetical protein n=1 Tax=Candidatus Fervidibacter sp. TaxID=3100871 RepID=UPI00404AA0E1